MSRFTLSRKKCGLLVIDVQERLFPHIERSQEILKNVKRAIDGFQILGLPIVVSEQYPDGLGSTIIPLQLALGSQYNPITKTTFSCLDDPAFNLYLKEMPVQQWILVGVEAHICVLQTAKGLLDSGKDVVVLNDAIGSRSIYDFSTGIAEMRDDGVRISSVETVLFELLRDSHSPEFKPISQLFKTGCGCC